MGSMIKTTIIAFLFSLFLSVQTVNAGANSVNAYFFYGDGCPHCAQERYFLNNTLKNKYPNVDIYEYEVYHNGYNAALLTQVAGLLKVEANGVPFLVIGDKYFIGYSTSMSPGMISQRVDECSIGLCNDSIASILGIKTGNDPVEATGVVNATIENDKKKLNLPFWGDTDVSNFSLPLLTVVLGSLDGFNPCAMWTLLFLISLLLGMKNRKRMWTLGVVFIIASAFVYFLFMAAWLNLILFLGFVIWVRILIGALAIFGGGYNLKEFIFNKGVGCKVADGQKRQRFFEKTKLAVQQNSIWLAIGGIIILAFAVNLIELVCSAGLPAVYTQVLALNEIPRWQYYLYILLYVFFFMLDDLAVFFIAMITLEMTGITTKYVRASRLVGGLLMLAIGLLLIFKPGWLAF